jgi:predicted dehydrogenase
MKKLKLGHIGWLAKDEGPECETVAWCDINASRMKRLETEQPGIRMYTDYREMLKHPGLDAVVISTPNFLHAEMAIAFLEAGKSVFLEKPMGINKAECDRILQTAARTKSNLTIDFELRVSPFAQRIKRLLDSGEFGQLVRLELVHHRGCWLEEGNGLWRVRKGKSGGHFLMEPIHNIDIFRYFAGEVRAVQTFASPNVLPQYEFPDNLCSHLFFENGVQALLLASHTLSAWHSWQDQQGSDRLLNTGHDMYMVFTLTGGSIMVDFLRARITVNTIEEYPKGTKGKRVIHEYNEEHLDFHAFAHDINRMRWEFIRRCANGQPMVQDPIDIWKTHLVCLAAEQSAGEDARRIEIDYALPEGV